MKTLTIAVDSEYLRVLDAVIKNSRLYSSRSEFVKDAVREKMQELVKLDGNLEKIKKAARALGKKALERGWDGTLLSKEEKAKIADEFIKEKGFA